MSTISPILIFKVARSEVLHLDSFHTLPYTNNSSTSIASHQRPFIFQFPHVSKGEMIMDRVDGISRSPLVHLNDFVLPDFFDHGPDFDPFARLIPGDTVPPHGTVPGGVDDGQFGSGNLEDVLGFNHPGIEDSNFALDGFPSFAEDLMDGEEDGLDDDEDDDDFSSGTTATMKTTSAATTPSPRTRTKNTKIDRSRTLISERRRRGRMKEKLYALRALVPNITKVLTLLILSTECFTRVQNS